MTADLATASSAGKRRNCLKGQPGVLPGSSACDT